MRYFVIGPDGSKYGPADLTSLNAWAAESRVLPSTMLEEEGTGRQTPASDVIGIIFPMSPPSAPQQSSTPPTFAQQPVYTQQPTYQSQPQTGYDRPAQLGGDGSKEMTWAWVCAALGFCCGCGLANIIGIILSVQAKGKGHPSATAALIVNIVILVLAIIGNVVFFSMRMANPNTSGF